MISSLFFPHRQFSKFHLLKRLPFSHCVFLSVLSNINETQRCEFVSGLSILFHSSSYLFLCYLNHFSFAVRLVIRHKDVFCFLFALEFFGYLQSFMVLYDLEYCSYLCKESHLNFIGIVIDKRTIPLKIGKRAE